ncbi:MAG: sigma-70 family RNA polymerase sigma factor [Pseudomonadota bacterium]
MRTLETIMPTLRRRARRLTRSQADADDLLHDVLVRLLARLKAGRQIDDLPRYAMRALSNEARTRWRRAAPTEELTEDVASTPPVAELRLACASTLRAIEQLPRPQADLMRRVAQGETSPKALARATGLPVGTVMSRLARARAALRERLE